MTVTDLSSSSPSGRRRFPLWLAIPFGLAAIALAAAIAVPTDQWAEAFHHPARQPMPPVTRDGAMLFRIMLIVAAMSLIVFPATLLRLERRTSTPQRTREPIPSWEMWALFGSIFLGFLIRATRITESLWYDEIAALQSFAQHSPGVIVANYFDPANHIAHTLLSHLSLELFESALGLELALRLPALLFSLGSIAAMYGLARMAHPRCGLIAALLAAGLPVSVLEGAEARGYSMMICLGALASLMFLTARRDGGARQWCLYAAFAAAGVWAHFVTAFVVIGHGAWLCWRAVRGERSANVAAGMLAILLAAILTAALYAPALPEFLQLLTARQLFSSSSAEGPALFGPEGLHALLQLGGAWYWWAALPGLALFVTGLVVAGRDREKREVAAAALLGLPLMIACVILFGSWVYARFTLFALPGAIVMMSISIERLFAAHRIAAAGAALAAVVLASAADLTIRPPKQPLREAIHFVATKSQGGESILAVGLYHRVIRIYSPPDLDLEFHTHGPAVDKAIINSRSAWIVIYYPHLLTPAQRALLEGGGYDLAAQFDGWVDWGRGDVLVYRRRGH